ncbi:MAG: CRISPR-associated protein Cas5 [Proteobacteria bacterium]|nr:CRISPR-associated protein Cas5 [Pseudomonadota bacterium]
MRTLWLRVRAPFAAFRWLQAGVYRATSPIIPPSAAWGLALNLAHIETRSDRTDTVVTDIRPDAPPLCIAVGQIAPSPVASIYQQLHSYPVGASGKQLAPRTRGAKYWIAPVRREVLIDLDCIIGLRSRTNNRDSEPSSRLLDRIPVGLAGTLDRSRYGLPFAGDNNFFIDRIDILDTPRPACWYTRLASGQVPPRGSCRLTVAIDRNNSSRTNRPLFAPSERVAEPPERAWTWCPRPPRQTQLNIE